MNVTWPRILLWVLIWAPVYAHAQYSGGGNDGTSSTSFCGGDLNGGAAPTIVFNSLVGPTSFCSFATDVYSISLSSGTAERFIWSLPAGSTIISSANTTTSSTVVIQFGNTDGSISVTAQNSCATTVSTPISLTATACNIYSGGVNDGGASATFCAIDLSGSISPPLALNAISGASAFCNNSTERYSVTVSNGYANSFYWTTNAGTFTTQTNPTLQESSVNILMNSADGSVIVEANNGCSSAMQVLSLTATNCGLTLGGNGDGFSSSTFCATDLMGTTAAAITLNSIAGPATFCNNSPENYTITLSSGYGTSYYWTNSSGTATAQNTPTLTSSSLNFLMSNLDGLITVEVSNGCTSASQSLAVTATDCGLSWGGVNDGFSAAAFCGGDLNGGAVAALTLNAISGPSSFCSFSDEGYALTLSSGFGNTYYWTGPSGSSVTTQANSLTGSISTLRFGASSGSITVEVSNGCSTVTQVLPVLSVNCNNFAGGNNDGFSSVVFCSNSLNGGAVAPLALNPITGNSNVYFNLGQNFSVTLASGNASIYNWTGPPGSNSPAQISSFTSSTALLNIGSSNGNVTVEVSNGCSTAQATLAVTGQNCPAYYGGLGDGFALPIQLVSFEAKAKGSYVELEWITASELNNDYFTIERSLDGEKFEPVAIVDGGGTSRNRLRYIERDLQPYFGKSYYRLKQTDFDKQYSYSEIRLVVVSEEADPVSLYPNPVSQHLNIKLGKSVSGKSLTIEAFDALGKSVMKLHVSGNDRITISKENGLPEVPGMYLFKIYLSDQVYSKKLVIQ